MATQNTTFQIVRFFEDEEPEFILSETSKSARLPFSVIVLFKGLSGQNVKLTSFTQGAKEATVLGRGGVLNTAGVKASTL